MFLSTQKICLSTHKLLHADPTRKQMHETGGHFDKLHTSENKFQVMTTRGEELTFVTSCFLLKQPNKKSSSSCEYDLTLCRSEINKCLTACVKQAFGCPTLHFQFPETLMEKSAEWTRSTRTGSSDRKLTPQLLQVFPPAPNTPANGGNALHKNACDQVNTVRYCVHIYNHKTCQSLVANC